MCRCMSAAHAVSPVHPRARTHVVRGDKVYYGRPEVLPGSYYMMVLSDAEALFDRGLTQVHHGQLVAYYECLMKAQGLTLLQIVPNARAVDYQKIWGKPCKVRSGAISFTAIAIDDETGAHYRKLIEHSKRLVAATDSRTVVAAWGHI